MDASAESVVADSAGGGSAELQAARNRKGSSAVFDRFIVFVRLFDHFAGADRYPKQCARMLRIQAICQAMEVLTDSVFTLIQSLARLVAGNEYSAKNGRTTSISDSFRHAGPIKSPAFYGGAEDSFYY
jgi:hypothetical protein